MPDEPETSSGGDVDASSGTGLPASEEFEGATVDLLVSSYGDWQVLHPERAERVDVGTIRRGWLVVEPLGQEQNAWFQDAYGPLVYQMVEGDFAVMTHLRVVSRHDPGRPPSKDFNAGGFVIRDPSGTHGGDENWVMYNMGAQGPSGVEYGREVKKTVDSNSDLFINPQSDLDAYLKVCRVGQRFYFFYWSSVDQTWREERLYNGVDVDGVLTETFTPAGTEVSPEVGTSAPGESVPLFFEHAALPTVLQVGVMGHGWSGPIDVSAEFDFVRFDPARPTSRNDCKAAFADPTLP